MIPDPDTLFSCHMLYRTVTTNMVITCMIIPPNSGMAMGTIMSDPFPVDVSTGISAIIVVAVVIIAGRTLFVPASRTDIMTS